jgi:hypothetical protein
MWLKSEGFVDRVRLWWSSYHFQGSPSYILAHKLKALTVDLRAWNEEFSNIGGKKQVMWKELWVLEEITRKATVINDLEMSTLLEEVSLRRNRWRFG